MLARNDVAHGRFSKAISPGLSPDLSEERHWRQNSMLESHTQADVLASHWLDERMSVRRESASTPADRYVVSVALRTTRIRLAQESLTVSEGVMPAGALHVTSPARSLDAEFRSPCEFVHLYVRADYMEARAAQAGLRTGRALSELHVRDPLSAQLGRCLVEDRSTGDRLYLANVQHAILGRVLHQRPAAMGTVPLQEWRLRKTRSFIIANIGGPITLGHLAACAGLSRMHFAAQFRAATGCSPCRYVLQQRIECAMAALRDPASPLVEIAHSLGFQTQSHFTTAFKRIVGDTPGQWRRSQEP